MTHGTSGRVLCPILTDFTTTLVPCQSAKCTTPWGPPMGPKGEGDAFEGAKQLHEHQHLVGLKICRKLEINSDG